ncbi:MAG: methyl-accepting chemotaxis protein, partial [Spirochaetes bacterium]|nr:methyl-accepting chemotaxis protein [Spirochaetota bacterium]
MPLIKKRRLKIRWRILFLVLPFTIIPLILIILFIRYSLFSYMEDQKLILNDALLYQIAQNVEEKYNEDSKKIIRLLDIPEIKDNIFKRAFVSKKEEEQISDWVNKGYDGKNTGLNNRVNELSIKGLVYIINRDRYSIKRDQPYSYWKTSKVSWDIKTDEMIKNSILKIAEQNIFINKHGVKSAKLLYFYPKSILPLFVFDPYENKKWYSLLFPIVNNTSSSGDRNSKYFEAFALIIQKNIVFEELFPKVIKDDILKGQSTIYILDYKNESIYSNVRTKNLEVKVSVDNTVLDNRNLQNILNDNYDKYKIGPNKTKVFDFKHKNNSYQTFVLDTNKITNMRSGIKFLYFYPKEIIYMPIYRILFRILIISFIIFIFVIIISVIISNSLSYPLIKLDYATNKVSQGYLDIDIISESRDEIGHLYRNFRRMINSHINVLANIQRSSNDLTGYQNSLDKVINNFDGTLKKQAMSISKSLAIFKELDSSIIKVVQNVKNAQGIIKQSQVYSDNSNVIINDMMNEIKRIARTSQEINSITNLINKI